MTKGKRRRLIEGLGHRQEAPGGRRDLIFATVAALRRRDMGTYRELLGRLACDGVIALAEVETVLREALESAGAGHWEPREIVRQTDRRLGDRHARYVTAVLAGRELAADLSCAVEVLALVLALPPLPKLDRPGPSRPQGDDRVLEKVRALLAKAESTTFPEEAEALSAKAQELMARHALDEALVGAESDDGAVQVPGGLRVAVDDPYARAKSILLAEVASANRCTSIWSEGFGFSTVIGFASDLEFVDVLYTSLLVQATSALVAAGSQFDRYGRSRTRSFRHAFLLAYARRIGERLRAAEAAVEEEYGAELLPVLASRSAAVEAARHAAFPHTVKRAVSVTNAAGWLAGSAAADLASLSGRTEVGTPV